MRACRRAGVGDVAWAAVSLLAAASAQSRPTWPELRVQLRSLVPAQVAWAAHHVAEDRLSQAGPDLTRALDGLRDRERFDGQLELALALLDAAVRCGAKLPAETLTRWAAVPECGTTLLAYAQREPADMAPVVRKILGATGDQATKLAACNLLLASDPRSLVTAVLAHSGIHVQVEVVAPGAIAPGTSMSVSFGKDLFARLGADGFPPVSRYRILPEQVMGDLSDRVLVDGPDRLFLVRVTEGKARQGTFHFGTLPSRADYAVRCLDWLVPRRDGAPPLGDQARQRHVWHDVENWSSAVVTPMLAKRDRWHQIVDWLLAQRMVDATQAAQLRASFHIEVSDQRVDRSKPLPEIK